jgi:putative component of toxin-antitoxin plasmid stabilization module
MKSIIRQTEEFARWHKKLQDVQARAVQEHHT